MPDARFDWTAGFDPDVALRDVIADGLTGPSSADAFVSSADAYVTPSRIALAALCMGRDPMAALVAADDLFQAADMAADIDSTCSGLGREWLAWQLDDAGDHLVRGLWHAVAHQDAATVLHDLEWLRRLLRDRLAVVRAAAFAGADLLGHSDSSPEPSPFGQPPVVERAPFKPKGWSYSQWQALFGNDDEDVGLVDDEPFPPF